MTTVRPPLSQTLIDSIEDYGNQHNSKFAFERWEKVGNSWMAVMWHKKKHHEFNVEANSKTYSAFRNKLGSAVRSYRKANSTPDDQIDWLVKKIKAAEKLGDMSMAQRLKRKLEDC